MEKIDLTKYNPFSDYKGDFSLFHSFGSNYDDWVTSHMLGSILPNQTDGESPFLLADIGAGSCYWPILFMKKMPNIKIMAIDPSKSLIREQASIELKKTELTATRLERRCITAQAFSKLCATSLFAKKFDCIYFMQSAHYVGDDEFENVFRQLRSGLKPKNGAIVIQARNMSPTWYPWAIPIEWKDKIEEALVSTSMFGRANKYKKKLMEMKSLFSSVGIKDYHHLVEIDAESYWSRLEGRWMTTFMGENIISNDLHRTGIDAMKSRLKNRGENKITWMEKFSVVTARV